MKAQALFSLGALLAAAAEAGPLRWVPVGPSGNPAILAMAVGKADYVVPFSARPSLLFAGTAGAGVFRSDDAGRTWVSTGPGLPGDAAALCVRQVFHLGVDTGSYETTVFAGTASGVYRLAPGATSWAASNAGLTSLDVRALAVGGDGVVRGGNSGVVYAGTAGGLFASSDGSSWVPKTSGLPSGSSAAITALAADPASPATLYGGTTAGLYKSADGGETWSLLDAVPGYILFVLAVAVDPLVPSRLYVDGARVPPCSPFCLPIAFLPVALRSLDGGSTWSTADGLGFNAVRAFAATPSLPPKVFAGTSGNGVFQSDDAGVAWSAANDGLGSALVSALVIEPVLPSLIFARTKQGVFCAPLGQVAVTCVSGGQTLCLNSRRFSAAVQWRDPSHNLDNGQALSITDNTGAFWFYDPTNLDLVVKVLDGRSVNGKFWVFYGALSNDEYTLTVTDTLTGAAKTYVNPQGQLASVADTSAF